MTKFSVNDKDIKEISSVQKWTAEETIVGAAVVIACYLFLIFIILPIYMSKRPAYNLKRLLLVYNGFQVALSSYTFYLYARYIVRHGIIVTRCPSGEDLKIVSMEIWPFFLAKHIDLLDTVFFVLRKKNSQVTFLHVIHHTLMVTWIWFYQMYHPSDHFVVVGLLNSLVHVLMYTYYGLAALGPAYSDIVKWKKHLTKVQLLQFIIALPILQYQQKSTPCPIHPFFHNFCLFSIISFLLLFANFYLRSYRSKTKLQKT